MCKGRRGSKWEKVDVCVKEDEVRCDGVPHCWKGYAENGVLGGEDEANCTHIVSEVIGVDYTESEEEMHEELGGDNEHVDCDGQEHWYHYSESPNEMYGYMCNKYYRQPTDGHCESEDDLICTARSGKWAGHRICLEKKFQCDNHVQCEDARDEENCETIYLEKKLFPKDAQYVCKSPLLVTRTERNESGKFFPMRAVRWI